MHEIRFPGESAEYRGARDTLLEAEVALRRQTEEVARLRRALPAGGALKEDYVFQTMDERPIRLSQLFRDGQDTLVLYSYMYGPQMAKACPMCTSIIDSLDGSVQHVTQRVSLAVVAKSPPARLREMAEARAWRNVQLLSSANNTYNVDYHAENAKGGQLPVLNVFRRANGETRHAYATELLWAPTEPGMDGRHVDSIWPLWNVFDFTPAGRGTDWRPKLSY